jgi:hypothetical protein
MKSNWRKSSYSGDQGNCIEVADDNSRVLVRDTKQLGHGPTLQFTPDAWRRFAKQVKQSLASQPAESGPPDSGGPLSFTAVALAGCTDVRARPPPVCPGCPVMP